jgi:hypothetical protein
LIDNNEKRVVRNEVVVIGDTQNRAYKITISYYELNNPNPSTLYIELKRTR